jgi:hypothetical protein
LPDARSLRNGLVLASASSVVAALFLLATASPAPLHSDTARDLLLARACVENASCASMGPPSSLAGFVQGATWIRVLSFARAHHGSILAVQRLALALLALAAGAMTLIAPRATNGFGRVLAAMLLVPAMLIASASPILWNPTLAPLPAVLLLLFVAAAVERRTLAPAIAAGVALGVSIDLHIGALVIAAPVLFVLVASAARPVSAAFGFLGAAAAYLSASSRDMLAHNSRLAGSRTWLVVATVVGVVALAWARRGEFAELTPADRLRRSAAVVAIGSAVLLAALMLVANLRWTPRYALVLVPWLCLIAGERTAMIAATRRDPWSRAVMAAACAALLYVFVQSHRARDEHRSPWSLDDVDRLAANLYADGWSFAALRGHLQARDSLSLLSGLASFEPRDVRSARDVDIAMSTRRTVPCRRRFHRTGS